ncbi:FecR family protein [Sphingorhabdus contaminans]|uniref:DUF4974 domain-containing protein n=1 Tax=Sphingorhabdus contaminans TaxID=1343899 RepID=A0A553WA64_9SPHN|nr:FecR domain-containing protein [Sphingorhabdus contaminans]TSB01580.1 DUF4974 domain-containing protein [Sphingorhabdus contaminans]
MSAALIEQQAAVWLMRREEPDWSPEQEAEFAAWMDAGMAHKAAYWRLEHAWRQADRIAALGLTSGESDGIGEGSDDNIVISETRDMVSPTADIVALKAKETASPRRLWRPAAIAASLALFGSTVAFAPQLWERTFNSDPTIAVFSDTSASISSAPPPDAEALTTPIGGRKMVRLTDGSRIELNTQTLVRADITNQRREVWLEKGEAYFEVKRADKLPFIVHAGNRTVTVLGTKFSVRRNGDQVYIAVVEGRVRVDESQSGEAPRTTIITGGEMVVAQGLSTLVTAKQAARVESNLAWRDGMLSFDRMSLGEAAAEFNRYNDQKIIVEPSAAAIRIGGTFRASNVDAFVRLLDNAYGLHVEEHDGQIVISGE